MVLIKNNMELKDTAILMLSSDYKERFKAEYFQLKIRYEKLKYMLQKWDAGELNFTPNCPRSLYNLQLQNMKTGLAILEGRAAIEGIKL